MDYNFWKVFVLCRKLQALLFSANRLLLIILLIYWLDSFIFRKHSGRQDLLYYLDYKLPHCLKSPTSNKFELTNDANESCKPIIFIDIPRQGIGNMLYQHASAMGIAFTTNRSLFYGEKTYPINYLLEEQLESDPFSFSDGPVHVLDSCDCCIFDPLMLQVPCHKQGLLRGYHQSYKYFHKYRETILERFKFKLAIRNRAEQKIQQIIRIHEENTKEKNCLVVGVHLRRGDFTEQSKIEFGHMPAHEDYFDKVYNHYTDMFPNQCLIFLLLGDDYNWISSLLDYLNYPNAYAVRSKAPKWKCSMLDDRHISCFEPAAIDLCVLANCNHTAFSTGSFGWWGAYLSSGHVAYQKEYARYGSPLYDQFNTGDYFPEEWIAL